MKDETVEAVREITAVIRRSPYDTALRGVLNMVALPREMEQQITALTAQLAAADSRFDSLAEVAATASRERDELRATNRDLADRLNGMEHKLSEANSEVARLKAALPYEWDKYKASQESLREHMLLVKAEKQAREAAEARLLDVLLSWLSLQAHNTGCMTICSPQSPGAVSDD